jgi:hypothetical protein
MRLSLSRKSLYVEVPPRLSITSIGKEKERGLSLISEKPIGMERRWAICGGGRMSTFLAHSRGAFPRRQREQIRSGLLVRLNDEAP